MSVLIVIQSQKRDRCLELKDVYVGKGWLSSVTITCSFSSSVKALLMRILASDLSAV